MIISMQGSWTVRVKSKNAAFSQRFIVSGADTGNGTYPGTVGTTANVTGAQWSITIQNNPGSGYQVSDTKITFPKVIAGKYEFEIRSNDAGNDQDFNDLILACTTWVNINDFIIYGNVSLYSGHCLFNPCRPDIFVIESPWALKEILKNAKLRAILERLYPERIRKFIVDPPPPDPEPFKPMVIDLFQESHQVRTQLAYKRIEPTLTTAQSRKATKKATADEIQADFGISNYALDHTIETGNEYLPMGYPNELELAKVIDGLILKPCKVKPATNLTLSFEEYDRTNAEMSGGAYTGEGDRRLLGDTVTDMHGNYIFRFSFDMSFPGLEDSDDQAPGESIEIVAYPDLIVKVTAFSPYQVIYESAPHYNIPNFKRIDLCLPEKDLTPSNACFNGNLIGSLGNVFLGGNQNSAASFAASALRRYEYGNYLEADGCISVGSSLAGFSVDCASWYGTIDFRGCMYDVSKTAAQNKIKWYTIRIRRAGTSNWVFVSQNYKHPRFSHRHLPNYTGDDVGPFNTVLKVDGAPGIEVPAYKNIQREIHVDGIDWEFANHDRYIQLNSRLFDKIAGETVPGTFYVRVDCYDSAGNPVVNGTDMIPLFIHNKNLNFALTAPAFTDPAVLYADCGLFRLTDSQMNIPVQLSFRANDPYGFVDSYTLTMSRCPAPMIALQVNEPGSFLTSVGDTILLQGDASGNTFHSCPGYTGTLGDFTDIGLITVEIEPAASESGWIKPAEYFTKFAFKLHAQKRMTNGYNHGLSDDYEVWTQILMERLNP